MNISLWIQWWAERTPDKCAIRFGDERISYLELAQRISDTAAALQKLGVRQHDRVAWLGYNQPGFLILLFACARIGAIVVPLNFRLAPPEHLYMLKNAGARLLVIDDRFPETAAIVRAEHPQCEVVGNGDPRLSESDGQVAGEPVSSDSPLLIVYTSGTTGDPKGAVLTQDSVHWNGLNSQFMHDLRRDDHVLGDVDPARAVQRVEPVAPEQVPRIGNVGVDLVQ